MFRDVVKKYYIEQGFNCAEAMIRAADEAYALHLTPGAFCALRAFGGGVCSGGLCGAVAGAAAALGVKITGGAEPQHSPDLRPSVGDFMRSVQAEFGSVNCSDLSPIYKKPELRCLTLVQSVADILEDQIGKSEQHL